MSVREHAARQRRTIPRAGRRPRPRRVGATQPVRRVVQPRSAGTSRDRLPRRAPAVTDAPRYCATAAHSTAPTPRWRARWPRASSPAELLDEFEQLVYRPRGLGRVFPPRLLLGDHITHELDILFATRPRTGDSRRGGDRRCSIRKWRVPNPFVPAFRNSRGLRLRATDVEWTHGEAGPLVEGRAAELVSVLGNRPRMLSALRGDGVELLASRVSPRRIHRAG